MSDGKIDQSVLDSNDLQSNLDSIILGSCWQYVLLHGLKQVRAFHPLSCQGIRIDICFIIHNILIGMLLISTPAGMSNKLYHEGGGKLFGINEQFSDVHIK